MTETHIHAKDYIAALKFEYFTTYSFHRSQDFLKLMTAAAEDFRNNGNESSVNCINLRKHPKRLTFDNHQFNPTGQKIRTFQFEDNKSANLRGILSSPAEATEPWLCKPMYRDGIVFYNGSNEIVSVLNICCECLYMQLDNETYVDASTEVFMLLREFLKDIGHPLENL